MKKKRIKRLGDLKEPYKTDLENAVDEAIAECETWAKHRPPGTKDEIAACKKAVLNFSSRLKSHDKLTVHGVDVARQFSILDCDNEKNKRLRQACLNGIAELHMVDSMRDYRDYV